MASKNPITIANLGNNIVITETANVNNTAYYSTDDVVSVESDFIDFAGAGDPAAASWQAAYPYGVMLQITIVLKEDRNIKFDIQQVTNQPTWLTSEAGLAVAKADIAGWL